MSIFGKIKGYFTEPIDDQLDLEDSYYEAYEDDEFEEPQPKKKKGLFKPSKKTIDDESNRIRVSGTDSTVLEYTPYSLDDMNSFIEALKLGKKIILHLDKVDYQTAQRLLDIASGAAYALGCTCVMAQDCECSYIMIPDESAEVDV